MTVGADLIVSAEVLGAAAAVGEAARAELPLLLADLERWVNTDSPSGDSGAVDALGSDIAATAEKYGARVEIVPTPAGCYVHAALEGGGASRVALLCHHDTVFERGTAAGRPFRLDDDLATGPGVADMKGGLVVAAHTLRLLRAVAPSMAGRVELVSVPDEEPRTAPFATLDRLRGYDAALCLECGRPGNGIVTSRKGGRWVDVAAEGRTAHPGVDAQAGRSALLAMCQEALRIASIDNARPGLGVQLTMLHAGEVANCIPARAALTVDVRAWSSADLEWAVGQIVRFGAHDGVRCSLVESGEVPPFARGPATARLAAAAVTIGEHLGRPVSEVATGGVSDVCWTAAAGIPSLDGLGPVGADDHSSRENVSVHSLAERCGLLAGLVLAVESARRHERTKGVPDSTLDESSSPSTEGCRAVAPGDRPAGRMDRSRTGSRADPKPGVRP